MSDDSNFEVEVDLRPPAVITPDHPNFANLRRNGAAVPKNRCVAHRKNGDRCKRCAIPGGTVCTTHGGAVSHVKEKARIRLQMQAAKAADELLSMALDPTGELFRKRPDVKLAAINSVLDRAGIKVADQVDVSVEVKPYEGLIDSLVAQAEITREQSRAARAEREANTQDAEVVTDV